MDFREQHLLLLFSAEKAITHAVRENGTPEGPEGGYITFYGSAVVHRHFRRHEVSPFLIMIVADDLS